MSKVNNTKREKKNDPNDIDENFTPLISSLVRQCTLNDAKSLKIYELAMTRECATEDFRIMSNGKFDPKLDTKKILIIGETGTGKTTLLNSMINYLFGVEYESSIRFKVVLDQGEKCAQSNQAMGQTSCISVYKIGYRPGMLVNYNIVLIDTPGFGDQGGIEQDQKIAKQIENLFGNKQSHIDTLSAVCFVVKSSSARLTPSESYVFHSVFRLFGIDIKNNIVFMITFIDSLRGNPVVLKVIEEKGFDCKFHCKFNNSSLFSPVFSTEESFEEEVEQIEKITWSCNNNSMKRFFSHVDEVNSMPLKLTKEVITIRNQIELEVSKIKEDINRGVSKLRALEDLNRVLIKHKTDIDLNKDFKCELTETFFEKVDLPPGKFATNCNECIRTCHDNCSQNVSNDCTMFCVAMDNNTFPPICRICDKNCPAEKHSTDIFKYEMHERVVERTADYLKSLLNVSKTDLNKAKVMLHHAKEQFLNIQLGVMKSIVDLRIAVERLNKIALEPNPVGQLDYIEKLIHLEECECKKGYEDRIKQLREVKQKLELLMNIINAGEDPFHPYLKELELNLETFGVELQISEEFKTELKAFCEKLKPKK